MTVWNQYRFGMAACVCCLDRAVTASARLRPATLRHEQGRSYLAMLVNWWLKRSDLSQDRFSRIVDWSLGEAGWLSGPQISHIRNRQLARGVNAKSIEALTAANHALWLWHTKGPQVAIAELGPFSSWGVTEESLDGATWLPRADDETRPLSYGDLCEIVAGRLVLPYLQGESLTLSPSEGERLSVLLSGLLNDLAGAGRPADGIARVLAAYPVDEPERRRRIQGLMLGELLSSEELQEELYALAITVATLRGVEPGSYGPAALHAELSSHRRRS